MIIIIKYKGKMVEINSKNNVRIWDFSYSSNKAT